ncbi:iron chaperone [Alkalihalobacillus oceani]|uniref:Iron chaperone n=1 Tax=Halalkalibacter oceani TaxID=1653776 RepID=A0A9X2DU32_9BACI|nr:iron chaperone [Halalkalibacter oceani]MCM3716447.1 iron chaperone [Halalkalibacter oceani]
MDAFAEFLAGIKNPQHQQQTEEVLAWVAKKFPALMQEIKWKQPMFTDHGTYIIGFSVAKHHLAVAPERAAMIHFANDIIQAGYDHTKELIRMPWDRPVDYSLLERIIEFNIMDKADCETFWRK